MESTSEDQDSERGLNASERSGLKRTNHEDFEGINKENLRVKKVRVPIDLNMDSEALERMLKDIEGQDERFEHGVIAIGMKEDIKEVSCLGELDGSIVHVKEKTSLDFDLNMPDLNIEARDVEIGLQDAHVIGERKVEIIDISSSDSSDEEEKLSDANCCRQKDKQAQQRDSYGSLQVMSPGLGAMEVDHSVGLISSTTGGTTYTTEVEGTTSLTSYPFHSLYLLPPWPGFRRSDEHQGAISLLEQSFAAYNPLNIGKRYTKEEKGKAKVGSSGFPKISLATYPPQPVNPQPPRPELIEIGQQQEAISPSDMWLKLQYGAQQVETLDASAADAVMQRASLVSSHTACRLAGFKHEVEDCTNKFFCTEHRFLPLGVEEQLGNLPGPFSLSLRTIREPNLKQSAQQLIQWKPSSCGDHKARFRVVPSLLDLSIRVLAENADAVVSLEPVPHILKRRLSDVLCNIRRMNTHILDLLLEGSPQELYLKECSWLTQDQFIKSFKNLDATNLRVLQLDLCGQCNFDYVLGETLARTLNSLPNLVMVSLRGACRLSDDAIKTLVTSAPALQSLNLCQCSLLTETGINFIADSLGSILKELFLDECQKIDAMLIVPALWKFKHLEVLSLAGIETVCDQFVSDIVSVSGQNLKELNFADCLQLSNHSMKYISSTCVNLRSLNISKLDKLTDVGLEYLADGCRSIETLILQGNRFSDEAIAAFLETSGKSMKYLSLNNVSKVGESTALSLLKCSPNLLSLDLSWCRRITNEALVLIVDSCLSLRLIKLFGCTQITDAFLNGHSNTLVRVVGLPNTPLLENMNLLDPEEVLLRYSPIDLPSSSNT